MTIHYFSGNTVNEVMLKAFDGLLSNGTHKGSRNGGALFLNDVEIELFDPRARELNLVGRKSNIFQLIAETIWVMAGKDELFPYLVHFLPRAPNYSDDGRTWRGAYGPRMYNFDQLQGVVDTFLEDGLNTRRATMFIHDPAKDAPQEVKHAVGVTRDTPCNLMMLFYLDKDGKFTARTIQRSGDAIFGAGSINLFEFSFIQEMMMSVINSALASRKAGEFPEILELGSYRHSTVNFHLYDATASQAEAVLSSVQPNLGNRDNPARRKATFPNTVIGCKSLACSFIDRIAVPLLAGAISPEIALLKQNSLFDQYNIPKASNTLYDYMSLTLVYIMTTRKHVPELKDYYFHDFHKTGLSAELYDAVHQSPFRKFKLGSEKEINTSISVSPWNNNPLTGKELVDQMNLKTSK